MQGMHLAETVIKNGLVTEDQLRVALTETRKTGLDLEESLLANGFITQSLLRDIKNAAVEQEFVELADVNPGCMVTELISKTVARELCILPLTYDPVAGALTLAMVRVNDIVTLDKLRSMLPGLESIVVKLASEREIQQAIDRCYGVELSIDSILNELEARESDAPITSAETTDSQPVVRLIDTLFVDAVRRKASDIHFEAEPQFFRIRYRLDGVLKQIRCIHKDYWAATLVRLKVLGGMNIAETRAAQDGRMSVDVDGRSMDFRFSCFPATNGECIVVRLLDRSANPSSLEELGLPCETLEALRTIVRKPEGLMLVTGPTGSGKSTTLYAALNEIRDESINIVTMEDPVEHRMALVRQCSVNSALKLDFATGIRAILRQDPDVILIGETRDRETCEMVARATMTGHRVMTTLHTPTALGSFARLQELGLTLAHLSGNLLALIAQRLVRKLCTRCKQPRKPTDDEQILLGCTHEIYEPGSCEFCNGIGYQGRQAVVELYKPDSGLQQLLAAGASVGELVMQAQKHGHADLPTVGLAYVRQGVTSLSELERVIDLDGCRPVQ